MGSFDKTRLTYQEILPRIISDTLSIFNRPPTRWSLSLESEHRKKSTQLNARQETYFSPSCHVSAVASTAPFLQLCYLDLKLTTVERVGISITEIIVVFVVALVLFGPEQLPVIARTIDKTAGQLKKTSDALRREFYNSVYPPGQDIRREIGSELKDLRSLKADVLSPPVGSAPAQTRQTVAKDPPSGIPPTEETA